MSTSYWAIVLMVCANWACVLIVEGYQNAAGEWTECPEGYELLNKMCYKRNLCEEGYLLHTDGMCYLIKPKPCPYELKTEEPTTTTEEPTTTTEEPTTTTEKPTTTTGTPTLVLDEQIRCPPGSLYFNDQCRKILCTQGEYYEGRCLSPACPMGTVWRGKRCQPPGYIKTILEIDNVIKNQFEYRAVTENINHVEYYTAKPYDQTADTTYETRTPFAGAIASIATTLPPKTKVEEVYPGAVPPDGCCLVKSPRLCRPYPPSWTCFNRDMKLCDSRICTRPLIYLRPPRIVKLTDPPMLIMPPNPPLWGCETSDCTESDVLNCSGCALGQRETCSAGCYNYFCPGDSCQYKNSEDFCALYPDGFGCNINDGYVWNSNSRTDKCH